MAGEEEALLAEVRAFLRAESTTRKLWRRRAWLGRRSAFVLLERVVLERYRTAIRNDDDARHAFVDGLLDALESIGALDLVSAGRWAEELPEPVEATRAERIWGGQPTPASTTEYARRAAMALRKGPAQK